MPDCSARSDLTIYDVLHCPAVLCHSLACSQSISTCSLESQEPLRTQPACSARYETISYEHTVLFTPSPAVSDTATPVVLRDTLQKLRSADGKC